MHNSSTHSSMYGFSHSIITWTPSTSNNCSFPSLSWEKKKPSAHCMNSVKLPLDIRASGAQCHCRANASKASKTPLSARALAASAYFARYSAFGHRSISRALISLDRHASKKMRSNVRNSGKMVCQVPSITVTLGLSFAQARSRSSTTGAHSTMMWEEGCCLWMNSALKPSPKPTSRTLHPGLSNRSPTHFSMSRLSMSDITKQSLLSNNSSLPCASSSK
mmetsp:Transcript_4281/g.12983  ORF Transcript_4281/g.12983 Transcript_4281/m.12983 type:complete len:220 (+) Transcript_4281:118-777(+)